MQFLHKNQVEYKYKCYKERLEELKSIPTIDADCECSRFAACLVETSQMVDFLFKELNISYDALIKSCDIEFCRDFGFCDKECNEDCVKGAVTKLLHEAQMDAINENSIL